MTQKTKPENPKLLVIGGAGYVGASTCAYLVDQGYHFWVLDDLSLGHRDFALGQGFTHARAGDRDTLKELLTRERFDGVLHFAAFTQVGESFQKRDQYFENNVDQTRALLEVMLECGVKRFIFSSTCAVFGDPGEKRISEDLPYRPLNPYGETKLAVEKMLQEFAGKGLQSIALRYFNAAGAEPKLRVGEWHEPESHLIPRVLQAALHGTEVQIFGTDYPTADGTCIRDYVHVTDLAQAHVQAFERLRDRSDSSGCFEGFNIGSENGFSVREVIQACEKVTAKKLKVIEKPRRPGDPPRLIGDSSRAKRELGYQPQYLSLESIVSSAWDWEKKRRQPLHKAVFLDRDGTLNFDPGYLRRAEELHLLPGVGPALAELKRAGYLLVIVTNQSGVGRGIIPPPELTRIHERLDELLREHRVKIDAYKICTHRPEETCICRKPSAKLLHEAVAELGIDVTRSFMVGDRATDLMAARNAGVTPVLVKTGDGVKTVQAGDSGLAAFVGDDLAVIAKWILKQ